MKSYLNEFIYQVSDTFHFFFWLLGELCLTLWEGFSDWFEATSGPRMISYCMSVWLLGGLYVGGAAFLIYILTHCLITGTFVYMINRLEWKNGS